ncbi:hypothetical protein GWI33_021617 [Rhynchophorus ferrugineus]|uniref:Uncharacterized protein n=1 Tax=Rhynchophorus ferrugineus TaxID=354439 RepID=A0A834ITJ0_RHYFE|nr:hypothetical protein GWI33_021617 [Rhynchophorus ferrugineus]
MIDRFITWTVLQTREISAHIGAKKQESEKQLEAAYDELYQVLQRTYKYFFIDRLKPAYQLLDELELPNLNQTGDGNSAEEESPRNKWKGQFQHYRRDGSLSIRLPCQFSKVRICETKLIVV